MKTTLYTGIILDIGAENICDQSLDTGRSLTLEQDRRLRIERDQIREMLVIEKEIMRKESMAEVEPPRPSWWVKTCAFLCAAPA